MHPGPEKSGKMPEATHFHTQMNAPGSGVLNVQVLPASTSIEHGDHRGAQVLFASLHRAGAEHGSNDCGGSSTRDGLTAVSRDGHLRQSLSFQSLVATRVQVPSIFHDF